MADQSSRKSLFQQPAVTSSPLVFNSNDFMGSEDPHLRAYEELKNQLLRSDVSRPKIQSSDVSALKGIMGGIQSATQDLEKLF